MNIRYFALFILLFSSLAHAMEHSSSSSSYPDTEDIDIPATVEHMHTVIECAANEGPLAALEQFLSNGYPCPPGLKALINILIEYEFNPLSEREIGAQESLKHYVALRKNMKWDDLPGQSRSALLLKVWPDKDPLAFYVLKGDRESAHQYMHKNPQAIFVTNALFLAYELQDRTFICLLEGAYFQAVCKDISTFNSLKVLLNKIFERYFYPCPTPAKSEYIKTVIRDLFGKGHLWSDTTSPMRTALEHAFDKLALLVLKRDYEGIQETLIEHPEQILDSATLFLAHELRDTPLIDILRESLTYALEKSGKATIEDTEKKLLERYRKELGLDEAPAQLITQAQTTTPAAKIIPHEIMEELEKNNWEYIITELMTDTSYINTRIGIPYLKNKGKTLLHCAVKNGLADIVNVLISFGAQADTKSKSKTTALHTALKFKKEGSAEIAALLLEHGARVDALDRNSETPLDKVIREVERKPQEDPKKSPLLAAVIKHVDKQELARARAYTQARKLRFSSGLTITKTRSKPENSVHTRAILWLLADPENTITESDRSNILLNMVIDNGSLEAITPIVSNPNHRFAPPHIISSALLLAVRLNRGAIIQTITNAIIDSPRVFNISVIDASTEANLLAEDEHIKKDYTTIVGHLTKIIKKQNGISSSSSSTARLSPPLSFSSSYYNYET